MTGTTFNFGLYVYASNTGMIFIIVIYSSTGVVVLQLISEALSSVSINFVRWAHETQAQILQFFEADNKKQIDS